MGSSVILPTPGQPLTGPDPGFRTPSVPNLVSFGFEKIDPPAVLYIQRDDVLTLQGATQVANEALTITARILLPFAQRAGQPDAPPDIGVSGGPMLGPGYIQTISQRLALTTVRTLTTAQIVLTEGYLLSLSIIASQSTQRGNTFTRAYLTRGASQTTPVNAFELLAAGYTSQTYPVVWPNSTVTTPSDGPGIINLTQFGNPAAGNDFSAAESANGRARLQAFSAKFVAGAGVGNRFVSFQIQSSGSILQPFQVQDTAAITAGQTVIYSLGPGATNIRGGGTPSVITLPVPSPFFGLPGVSVVSSTQGILAADQWSSIIGCYEEWLELF